MRARFAMATLLLTVMPAKLPAAETGPVRGSVAAAYPLLAQSALGVARLEDLPAGIILQATDLTLSDKDLEAEIAKAPATMQGQLRQNAMYLVEQVATRSLVLSAAKAWAARQSAKPAQSDTALIQAYLKNLAAGVNVSEAEVRAFYEANKGLVGGLPLDQVKSEIRSYLTEQKQQAVVRQSMSQLVQQAKPAMDRAWAEKHYQAAIDNPVDKARLSGKPTLVDFGASGCGPCDMMAPILESLRREYEGKANVVFVQVREQPVLASRYGITSIPVQVFFDREGKEVFRHVGFFPEADLKAKLAQAGAR